MTPNGLLLVHKGVNIVWAFLEKFGIIAELCGFGQWGLFRNWEEMYGMMVNSVEWRGMV